MTIRTKVLPVLLALLILSMTTLANVPLLAAETHSAELRWKKTLISIAFSNSLLKPNPAIRAESDVPGAVRRSLEVWEAVADIEFQVTWTDKVSVSPAGNSGDGTSLVTIAQTPENLAIFSGDADEISARTRVFFNRRGIISEADIVLNSYQQFSTDGSIGTFDLESTLTHEIGHLLGLEHSSVIGATMNEFQGKNGIYNLSSFSPRTLGEDDAAALRAIYGAKLSAGECCGSVDGKLTLPNGRAAKSFGVWLEEKASGKVVQGKTANLEGAFRFEGLKAGQYRVFTQHNSAGGAAEQLGEVEIVKGKTVNFNRKVTAVSKNFDFQLIGFNGQLSRLAVPVNGGKSYQIYVGGKNLRPDDLKVGANSPFITIHPENLIEYEYGKELSVFSFEIKIDSQIPLGEYSIYLQNSEGRTGFLLGAVTVEKFLNPWNIYNWS